MKLFNNWNHYGYLFVLPFFLLLLSFTILPILFTFGISFASWDHFTDFSFVGFENYKDVLSGTLFYKSLLNTLLIMAIFLPINIGLAVGIAYILNEKLVRGASALKIVYFLPYITTPVAVGVFFGLLFNYQTGFINLLLDSIGWLKEPVYWLSKPVYAILIVSLIMIWKYMGYNMVLFLAGLQTIPKEVYEAAEIDGAGIFSRFRHIALPMLRPITLFVVITSLIGGLQIFDEPVMLFVGTDNYNSIASTLGGPQRSVYTLVSYVYEEGFILFRTGRSAAVAYLMTIIIVAMTFVSFKWMNRRGTA